MSNLFFKNPNPENPKDWPYLQTYVSRCIKCSETYHGPKGSATCWYHHSSEGKELWLKNFKES